jgi:hypothetical protein
LTLGQGQARIRDDLTGRVLDTPSTPPASQALADYDRALELVSNQAERRYLAKARRLAKEPAMPPFGKSPPEPRKKG